MTSRVVQSVAHLGFARNLGGGREGQPTAGVLRAERGSNRSDRSMRASRSSGRSSGRTSGRTTGRDSGRTSGRTSGRNAGGKSGGWMQKSLGVPARFMEPRVQLCVVVAFLVLFGLVMVYSASSIEAMNELGRSTYYFERQLVLALVGTFFIWLEVRLGYHAICTTWFKALWAFMTGLLLLTAALGIAGGGAVRWISIFGFSFQPSEFAKIGIVVTFAILCQRYYEERSITLKQLLAYTALGVGLPLLLIIKQPDKGTTLIMVLTLFVMLSTTGLKLKPMIPFFVIIMIAALVLALHDDYSRARVLTMLDPWRDRFGDGYQVTQGFIAFGNGGLFGRGIGQSMQKYSFLPEAHNDFIFAVVGEECGLVGTSLVVLAFIAIIWLSYKIARNAPDLSGKLIASGAASVLGIQFLVNVGGILGLSPMTGKPLPFLSYGGSSILSCLMLVGLILAVSEESVLPETVYDRARGRISLTTGGGSAQSGYNEGVPGTELGRRRGFTLLPGGATSARRPDRIDLGPSSTDRLRGKDVGPTVRRGSGRSSSRPRSRRLASLDHARTRHVSARGCDNQQSFMS